MRPLKSSVSSVKLKFKFVDDSMCVVCLYMYIFHLEMGSHCQPHDTKGYHKIDKILMTLRVKLLLVPLIIQGTQGGHS